MVYLFGRTYEVGRLVGLDSYFALAVPAMFSAYGTFMLRQYFLSIPRDLEEAATIDGCGLLRIFTYDHLAAEQTGAGDADDFHVHGQLAEFLLAADRADAGFDEDAAAGIAVVHGIVQHAMEPADGGIDDDDSAGDNCLSCGSEMVYKRDPVGRIERLTEKGMQSMYRGRINPTRELLGEVRHRVPAGTRLITEAFTTDHRRPVLVKLSDLTPETFYLFDEITAQAFRDAVVEIGARDGGGRLTVCDPFPVAGRAQEQHLQRVAGQSGPGPRAEGRDRQRGSGGRYVDGISRYRRQSAGPIQLCDQGRRAAAVVHLPGETARQNSSGTRRSAGFFSVGRDVVEEVADDVELLLRGVATTMATFEEMELLHRTTQRVSRELESYSRRVEWAVRHARRRPDLLTPARFDRIVGQAIAKMGQLKEIPRRALRSIEKGGF